MKRHYVPTNNGYRCVLCREEFATRKLLGKHYTIGGKCKHPILIGLTLDLSVNEHHWVKAV